MGEWVEQHIQWVIGGFVTLIGIALEFRIRKLGDSLRSERVKALEKIELDRDKAIDAVRRELNPERRIEDLRRELQVPISNIGTEAMEATKKVDELGREVSELTGRIDGFMGTLEQYVPTIFRGPRR